MAQDENTTNFTGRRLARKAACVSSASVKVGAREQELAPRAPKSPAASGYMTKMQVMEEELKLLTSFSSDTVYRLRYSDMKYDYVSPAVKKLLGFEPEEMQHVLFRSLILETKLVTDGMRTVKSYDELEEKRRNGDVNVWQADYLIRTKDGRKVWVADVSHPWLDENGRVIGSVGSMRDITDRIEMEAQARAELERIAYTDALTGIPNRRQFFSELDRELRRIKRTDSEVAMLLIDVDHFKKVNDTYGHDVGDRVLIDICSVIDSCLRETDLLARIGGEEFGVLLPETDPEGGLHVAERIRKAVMAHDFRIGSDRGVLGCSVSIGVSGARASEDRQSSDLYKMADTRLYIAKNTGRNQVSQDDILQTH